MSGLLILLYLTGARPLWEAWRANRHWALVHAVGWGGVAWLGWLYALAGGAAGPGQLRPADAYVALCGTACAAAAVLGARRPGVAAWDLVVLGLLAVLLLPLAEGPLLGRVFQIGTIRTAFLVAAVGIGVVNYLPTRLGPAAALVGAACGLAVAQVAWPEDVLATHAIGLCLAAAPWAGWAVVCRGRAGAEVERLWLDYRDRYGLVWGLRLRDQFNRAAANAGWAAELHWTGLRATSGEALGPDAHAALAALLLALLQRFGPEAAGTPREV